MRFPFILSLILLPLLSVAQSNYSAPNGGGEYVFRNTQCVTDAQRAIIEKELAKNRQMLIAKGILSDRSRLKTTTPKLDWPIKQAAGFDYFNIYAISNFVDRDAAYPNKLQDYNCGTRTYDLQSGYNHAGVDIFLWPFSINMMDRDQPEIVAAAPGTILAKFDGSFDKNCQFNSDNWNAVYIEHADGSVAWYGHMKKNSLTQKSIGASVVTGEYLGVVGSSGNSTGPHLHFEIRGTNSNVEDPYNGPCNSSPSLWNNQKPYRESKVNTLMTHHKRPDMTACPNPDVINARDTFLPGASVILAAYYSDQVNGQQSNYSILRPDNSVYTSWTHSASNGPYNASWWYWTRTISSSSPRGKYIFRVVYESKTYEHEFYILDPAGINSTINNNKVSVYPNPAKDHVSLTGATVEKVEVFDVTGKLMKSVSPSKQSQISVADLQNGFYMFKIYSGGEVQINKVLISR